MKKLIIFLLLFCAFKAESQVYQKQASYGFEYKRLKIDSTLLIPTFCGAPTLRGSVIGNQSAISFDSCNNRLYYYNPKDSVWNIVGSGGGGSCDTCISTITQSDDSTKFIFLRANGDTAKIVEWTGSGSGGSSGTTTINAEAPIRVKIVGSDTTLYLLNDSMPKLTYIDTTGLLGKDLVPADWVLARLGSGIQSVVAGTNVTVDNTDPLNPVVSSTAGGTGTVTSIGTGYGLTGGPITSTGTIVVDSAALHLKFLGLKDSGSIYATPKQLHDSIAANKIPIVTKAPLLVYTKMGGDPYDSLGIRQSSATDSGYLSKEDWKRFNERTDSSFRIIRSDFQAQKPLFDINNPKGLFLINYAAAVVSDFNSSPAIYFRDNEKFGAGASIPIWWRMYTGSQGSSHGFYLDYSTDSTVWSNKFSVNNAGNISTTSLNSSDAVSVAARLTVGATGNWNNNGIILAPSGVSSLSSPSPFTRLAVRDTTNGVLFAQMSTNAKRRLGETPYKGILVGGSGYTATSSNYSLTGGSGTGASAALTITGGVVTVATPLISKGIGYKVGDVLSASLTGGSGFSYTITKLQGDTSCGMIVTDTTLNRLFIWNCTNHAWEPLGQNTHSIFTPTTGGTVTTTVFQEHIINPAGTLAALTIALPSAPYNNDHVWLKFTKDITAITYSGGTVVGLPTSATAGQQWYLTYDSSTSIWY